MAISILGGDGGGVAVENSQTNYNYFVPTWGGSTSGTGSTAISVFGSQRVEAPTSAVGFGIRTHVVSQNTLGNPDNSSVNFSKKIIWTFRLFRYAFGTTDVNSVCRASIGKTGGVGEPAVKSIGISFTGTGVLRLMVHDGTTLRYVDTTFTPVHLAGVDIAVINDGSGNASLFINGTLSATSANAPTGFGVNTPVHGIEVENTAILTNSRMGAYYSNVTINSQP